MLQKLEFELLFDWILKTIPDIFSGINTSLIKNKMHKIQDIPPLQEWLSYYERSDVIINSIAKLFYELHSECEGILDLCSFYLCHSEEEISLIISKEIEHYNSLSDINKKMYISEARAFCDKIKNESNNLLNENYDYITSEQALSIISKPELLFFIRVIFPCLMLHGNFPINLLNKAKLGDEESLEKIIRIDKSIMYEPEIGKYLHQLSFRKPFHFQILIKRLVKEEKKLSKSQIKLRFRGLLSKIAKYYEETGIKSVTSPEIRSRFEFEFPEDELKNKKDPINENSYYRQDSRYRDFWLIFSDLDKK